MLASMAEQDFDDVIAVHLKGTFNVTRHAADLWRERFKGGDASARAIVNTFRAPASTATPARPTTPRARPASPP